MNRPLGLALAATLLLAPLAARAGEPPHFELVRGLRERHEADLALEYLRRLQQRKDLPPAVAARLPLEVARAQIDRAADTPDLGDRLDLYAQARRRLQDFLARNANSPLANGARLDLAHVAALEGKTQLSRALRDPDPAGKAAEAARARQLLKQAGAQLAAVVPLLDQQAKAYPEPETEAQKAEKKELEQARLQARLDVALNLFDQALTYVDQGKDEVLRQRSKVIEEALDRLKKDFVADDKEPLYWVGQAWLGRLMLEHGEPQAARKKLGEVLDQSDRPGEPAVAGKRLARYFVLLTLLEGGDPAVKDPWKEVRDAAGRWVKDYPAYLNTPEGYGIRYLLAEAEVKAANDPRNAPSIRHSLLGEARALCKDLEQADNDFTAQARQLKLTIIKQEGVKGDVQALLTFDDCYARAQYEDAVIEERQKAHKLTEAERREHLATITEALTRALALAPKEKVPEDDLNDAKTALAFAYLTGGDLVAAARLGEEVARLPKKPPQAARAVVYALHALAGVVADPEKAKVAPEAAPEYRDRLRALAEYAKKTWPAGPPADVARHELGVLAIREENYPAAVEELASIRPGYGGAIVAQYELAMAALEAEKRGLKPTGADKRPWEQQAREALEKMPDLPAHPEPGTSYVYVMARLRLGELYYRAKNYDRLAALADPLLARLPELTFETPDRAEQARSGLTTLSLLAKYGKAEQAYNAARYDEAVGLLAPLLPGADKVPEFKSKPELRWAVLGLLLRAYIQAGKLDQAQKVLDVLQALSSGNELEGGGPQTLVELARLLKGQVEEVRRKQPDQLDRTIKAFGKFLDTLTEQQQKAGPLSPEVLLLLADSYSALDNHKKAAGMLRAYPEPKESAPQKDRDTWQVIRVAYVRQLRLDGQTDEAKKELDGILATPWGPRNLEAQKERAALLMEPGKYMTAAREWDRLVKGLVSKFGTPGMKEQYFECYYWLVVSLYRHAQEVPEAKRPAALRQAANFVAALEARWPDFGGDASKARFQDLLDREAPLKQAYEQLKSSRGTAPARTGSGSP